MTTVTAAQRSYAALEAELDAILAEDEDADLASSQEDGDADAALSQDDTAEASPLPSPPLPFPPLPAMDANAPLSPLPPLPALPPMQPESEAHRALLQWARDTDEAEPRSPRSAGGGVRCPAAEREAAQTTERKAAA